MFDGQSSLGGISNLDSIYFPDNSCTNSVSTLHKRTEEGNEIAKNFTLT